jgi:hypothetical protein
LRAHEFIYTFAIKKTEEEPLTIRFGEKIGRQLFEINTSTYKTKEFVFERHLDPRNLTKSW